MLINLFEKEKMEFYNNNYYYSYCFYNIFMVF